MNRRTFLALVSFSYSGKHLQGGSFLGSIITYVGKSIGNVEILEQGLVFKEEPHWLYVLDIQGKINCVQYWQLR